MKNSKYFQNHPVYNNLPYHFVVGFIQLLTDDGYLSRDERKGYYINFINFRDKAKNMYDNMEENQKLEYIEFFKYKAYLDTPPPKLNV